MLTMHLPMLSHADVDSWYPLRIIWWILLCGYIGRSAGRTIDIQYREPEGKPRLIPIDDRHRWLYHFRFEFGCEVVREGVYVHILGYSFAFLELCVLILTFIFDSCGILLQIGDWLVILYAMIVTLVILTPMSIRYERNLQTAYDCDWITQIQEKLTIFPKRRCKIVTIIDANHCEIALGRFGKKRYLAKHLIPVSVGERQWAVHSNEHGSPFWTVRDH